MRGGTNTSRHNRLLQLLFGVLVLVCIQFFWVFGIYETLESEKVIWWVIVYILPVILIVGIVLNIKMTDVLFYSNPKLISNGPVSRFGYFRDRFFAFFLFAFVSAMFCYNTIIQTNDWFGTKELHTFNTPVITCDCIEHGRARKTFSGGNVSYKVDVLYKNDTISLSLEEPCFHGEIFTKTVKVGGAWGILYQK